MEHEPEGQQAGNSLTLADGLRLARRYWIGIIAFVAAATALAFGWYLIQPKVYAADSSGIVVAGGADNLGLSLAGDNLAKAKVKSYKSVAESLLVADRVVKDLGLPLSGGAIAGGVTVSVPADTAEIHVTAHSTDPVLAQKVADDWVVALAAQVRELELASSSSSTAEPAVRVVPLAKAALPGAPVSPNLKLALGIGGGAGLLLGLGYALLRGYLDRRIRTATDAERTSGHPVIGTLPTDARLAEGSRILEAPSSGARGSHAMGEALRELRTNLQFIDVDNPPRIILVTSSVPSEGKSTVIGNLAAAMASAGEDVVVVDADLRRPTVHDVFDVVPGVGLTDVLAGRASVEDVLQTYAGVPNLKVLGAGRIPPNPSELLGSRMMKNLLAHLAEDAVVLVDAPPLLPVTDAAVLSRAADGTIIVSRAGKTTTDGLERAVRNLDRVRGKILGVILNGVSTKGPESYTYGYYGTYSEHQRGREKVPGGRNSSKGKGPKGKAAKVRTAAVPAEAVEVPVALEPAYASEPVHTSEPAYTPEPAYVAEPVHVSEPAYTPEPYVSEPVHVSEPAYTPEPAYVAEPVHVSEPAYTPEPYVSEPVLASEPAYAEPRSASAFPAPQLVTSVHGSHTALDDSSDRDAAEPAVDEAPSGMRVAEAEQSRAHLDEVRLAAAPAPLEAQHETLREGPHPRHDRSHDGLRFTSTRPQPIISAIPLHAPVQEEPQDAPSAEPVAPLAEDGTEMWLPAQLRGRRSAG
ncbi:hypothetical protein SCMU_31810 [Sinomonas cyclohexanicum]|uniref:Capsular exopolysaccharide family n=1 Tax=Sinomonas cyclohexanicum TaxID=322009 RepID=A0ABN6FKL0_SINCY|nr:polysaccharide biosynthesis tyrosine autokinase [Corynebacterium cyclohexanicum]BCT77339.1 hypothetical protein SCMU_31810 [Corynebacterium cyclohexanicum]